METVGSILFVIFVTLTLLGISIFLFGLFIVLFGDVAIQDIALKYLKIYYRKISVFIQTTVKKVLKR